MNTVENNKMPIKNRIILMDDIWNTLRKKIEEGSANYISIDELKTNSQ